MSGISAQYTEFEKVEITGVSIRKTTNLNWEAIITLKNSGSAATTINSIMVGDNPVTLGQGVEEPTTIPDIIHASSMPATGLPLASGETSTITLWIGGNLPNSHLSSGTTVNIKVHSAGGMDYLKMVKLT